MRIAILLFGRSRHAEHTYPTLVHSLGNHSADVFYSGDNEPIEKLIEICTPVSLINEPITYTVDFSKYPIFIPDIYAPNFDSMTRHFINKKRVFILLEDYMAKHGVAYDLVICARLDIPIHGLAIPEPAPAKNTVYIPLGYDYFGINDRFAMGDVDSMKKYMLLYDSAVYLLDTKVTVPHPESLALANIKYKGLEVVRIQVSTEIIR
jgi:hypothetical protein